MGPGPITRFEKNVPGPFYTTGHDGYGDCLACGTPESEAPDLLAGLEGENFDTYFVRQPETPAELERACRAAEVCCVGAIRYGGSDPVVRERLGNNPEFLDFVADSAGDRLTTLDDRGALLPEFAEVIVRTPLARRNRFRAVVQGRGVLWRVPWLALDASLPRTPLRRTRDRRRLAIVLILGVAGFALCCLIGRAH